MSAYVFVSVAGGSLGLLAGGVLTEALSWHWVFFVNLPIGVATFALGQRADPGRQRARPRARRRLARLAARHHVADERDLRDRPGHEPRLALRRRSLGFGALAAVLMAAFVALEARIENPIMPLRILRLRGLVNASLVRGFLVTGHVLDVLPRHALPRARPPLQRAADGRGVPALDAHGRRAVAGHHGAAGRALRAAPRAHRRHGERGRRAAAVQHGRTGHRASSRRSSSPASRSASASATRSCRC